MCIRFDKTDEFISIYDGTRYFTLFGSEKYVLIYSRVRHIISLKNSITYVFSDCHKKIKIDSYGFLPIQKYGLCIML